MMSPAGGSQRSDYNPESNSNQHRLYIADSSYPELGEIALQSSIRNKALRKNPE